MAKGEKMLLVLYYGSKGEQTWCAYGGHDEADSELKLMERDGSYEVGRIPCERRETWTPVQAEKTK